MSPWDEMKRGEYAMSVSWFTNVSYSGNTADPRWESSSSSMVKPLQLTCGHRKTGRRDTWVRNMLTRLTSPSGGGRR